MRYPILLCLPLCLVSFSCRSVQAIKLNLDDTENTKQVASKLAWDLVSFYTGNNTGDVPGNLPSPYYWWEAGAFFGTLVNYWSYTGDTTYNNIVIQALLHQAGSEGDFMPTNQTRTEGNDDQAFWAFTAMRAAESNFTNPPDDKPSWLAMVQAVFNQQAARWNNEQCGGGLKWQIYSFNGGYNYRNAISNGCFFNMAARLARYTNNETYAEWAEEAWDWSRAVGLIGPGYRVFDGTSDTNNCSDLNHIEWTYNNGVFLHGAAHMWNYTNGGLRWKARIEGLLKGQQAFLSTNESSINVLYESACELAGTCQTDQFSFKAYLARWMGDTVKLAPFTYDAILARLGPSAEAAAAQCVGGKTGSYCGMQWTTGAYDGTTGVGQQMSALEVILANLLETTRGPLTGDTGGTSKGNSGAGTGKDADGKEKPKAITTADRAGAGILTGISALGILGVTYVMIS